MGRVSAWNQVDWEHEEGQSRVARDRRLAEMLFESGTGNDMDGVAGSVWAALNGVTEYLDHRRMDPEARLDSVWFGEGYAAKMRAFHYAMRLVGEWPDVQPPIPSRRRVLRRPSESIEDTMSEVAAMGELMRRRRLMETRERARVAAEPPADRKAEPNRVETLDLATGSLLATH